MPGRILCVEDEEDYRELICEFLVGEGYSVTPAANGNEALELISESPQFDLILCDIAMPFMDGYRVLEILRCNHPNYLLTPFIFLTAYNTAPDIAKAHTFGCDEYVVKPVDFDLLANMVASRIVRVKRVMTHYEGIQSAFQQQLVRAMAQEMVEPTNGVLSLASFLSQSLRNYEDEDLQARFHALYSHAGVQMNILQQVLTMLSQHDTDENKAQLAENACDVSELIRYISSAVRANEDQTKLEVSTEPGLCLLCDPFLISRAVTNAVRSRPQRASTKRPHLSIDMATQTQCIHLRISDEAMPLNQTDTLQRIHIDQQNTLIACDNVLKRRMISSLFMYHVAHIHKAELYLYYNEQKQVSYELVFPSKRTVKFRQAV